MLPPVLSALIDSSADRWSGVAEDSGVGDLEPPDSVRLSSAAETGVRAGVVLGDIDPEIEK